MSHDEQSPETPSEPTHGTTRLFQIKEDDLAELERSVPDICHAMYAELTNRQRVQFRRLREILADVRWNYGPPGAVRVFPA